MSFKIQRNSKGDFTLEYTQHFDYLPTELAKDAINILTSTLSKVGIKECFKLKKGFKIKYHGTPFQILTIIIPELLSQAKETEINKLIFIIKHTHTFLHGNIQFESEWNKEIEKKLAELGNKRLKNPLVV